MISLPCPQDACSRQFQVLHPVAEERLRKRGALLELRFLAAHAVVGAVEQLGPVLRLRPGADQALVEIGEVELRAAAEGDAVVARGREPDAVVALAGAADEDAGMAGGDHHHGRALAAIRIEDAVELAGRKRAVRLLVFAEVEPVGGAVRGHEDEAALRRRALERPVDVLRAGDRARRRAQARRDQVPVHAANLLASQGSTKKRLIKLELPATRIHTIILVDILSRRC